MKLSNRERFMLIMLGVVVVMFLYYNYLIKPQFEKINALNIKTAEYSGKVNAVTQQASPDNKVYRDYKILNAKVQQQSERLFPSIVQEKIVEALNGMITASGLNVSNITFSIPGLEEVEDPLLSQRQEINVLEELTKQYQKGSAILGNSILLPESKTAEAEKEAKEKEESVKLEEMIATLKFTGSYLDVIAFLQNIELYDKKIIVKSVSISRPQQGPLTGTIALSYYVFPKLQVSNDPYLDWIYNNEYGKGNPFEAFPGYIGGSNGILTAEGERTLPMPKLRDFTMTINPIMADLPTVTLGKTIDSNGATHVYADNTNNENIELQLLQNNGKYYYKYKTQNESYPKKYDKDAVGFVPGSNTIEMMVVSNPRTGATDKSGVNLTVINKTDLAFVITVSNDDKTNSRLKIVKQSGNVTVVR